MGVSGLGSGSGVIAIAAGFAHSLALKSDGTVAAWGGDGNGQLGDGRTGIDSLSFFPVGVIRLGSGSSVIAIAAGAGHSLALKSDDSGVAWGTNSSGQLGDGTKSGRSVPVAVSGFGSGSGVAALSGAFSHSLALKSDGSVLASGGNGVGQLGDGTTTERNHAGAGGESQRSCRPYAGQFLETIISPLSSRKSCLVRPRSTSAISLWARSARPR